MTANELRIAIQQRNALRLSAGLPQLVEAIEVKRGLIAARDLQFEDAFSRHRHSVVHIWTNPNEGWLSRSARWSAVRAEFRMGFDNDERELPKVS